MTIFICKNIGQDNNSIIIEQKRNTDGTYYYRAYTTITHVFGSEIQGAPVIEGFGVTREQACERLDKELTKFNDSLWF